MTTKKWISTLDRFAIIRERILARRNPDRFIQELAELAAMTDEELDGLEYSLIIREQRQ